MLLCCSQADEDDAEGLPSSSPRYSASQLDGYRSATSRRLLNTGTGAHANEEISRLECFGLSRCPRPSAACTSPPPKAPVSLNIYHLIEPETNLRLLRFGFGVFHTGVVVYGIEWSFGESVDGQTTGLFCVAPGTAAGTLFQTLEIGVTDLSPEQVDTILHRLENEWQSASYHVLNHNCNHFAERFCKYLSTVENLEVPPWCNRSARWGSRVIPQRLATWAMRQFDEAPPVASTKSVKPSHVSELPSSVIPLYWYRTASLRRPPRYRISSSNTAGDRPAEALPAASPSTAGSATAALSVGPSSSAKIVSHHNLCGELNTENDTAARMTTRLPEVVESPAHAPSVKPHTCRTGRGGGSSDGAAALSLYRSQAEELHHLPDTIIAGESTQNFLGVMSAVAAQSCFLDDDAVDDRECIDGDDYSPAEERGSRSSCVKARCEAESDSTASAVAAATLVVMPDFNHNVRTIAQHPPQRRRLEVGSEAVVVPLPEGTPRGTPRLTIASPNASWRCSGDEHEAPHPDDAYASRRVPRVPTQRATTNGAASRGVLKEAPPSLPLSGTATMANPTEEYMSTAKCMESPVVPSPDAIAFTADINLEGLEEDTVALDDEASSPTTNDEGGEQASACDSKNARCGSQEEQLQQQRQRLASDGTHETAEVRDEASSGLRIRRRQPSSRRSGDHHVGHDGRVPQSNDRSSNRVGSMQPLDKGVLQEVSHRGAVRVDASLESDDVSACLASSCYSPPSRGDRDDGAAAAAAGSLLSSMSPPAAALLVMSDDEPEFRSHGTVVVPRVLHSRPTVGAADHDDSCGGGVTNAASGAAASTVVLHEDDDATLATERHKVAVPGAEDDASTRLLGLLGTTTNSFLTRASAGSPFSTASGSSRSTAGDTGAQARTDDASVLTDAVRNGFVLQGRDTR